jgi:para-aminobenzoate synthetase component 1
MDYFAPVQRNHQQFALAATQLASFKNKMLNRAYRFNISCLLDNHSYPSEHHTAELLAAFGAIHIFSPETGILEQLSHLYASVNDWLFGHIGYSLTADTLDIKLRTAKDGFGKLLLFIPETVVEVKDSTVHIYSVNNCTTEWQALCAEPDTLPEQGGKQFAAPVISREAYLASIRQLQQHILKGDCYEINFCQEFRNPDAAIHPLAVYRQLSSISPTPFSAFYKVNEHYALCASPERYLKKTGSRLLSQPIKGTIRRDNQNAAADQQLKDQLYNSPKDRSENVMVVDLVRNDLSRICNKGSVQVSELYGMYTYPNVHQMISTVEGTVDPGINLATILANTFPMGSMTGAPKKKVAELIEQYEASPRGLFSGSIGYITPGKDFDFNVVIRSLFYHAESRLLQYFAGGGITFYSNAEEEYEESMLKAESMLRALS